jgi:hypothetical protein
MTMTRSSKFLVQSVVVCFSLLCVGRVVNGRALAAQTGDTVSDLRYLLNCCWLLVAMRGSRWRHDSPRKRLRPPRGIPVPAQQLQ